MGKVIARVMTNLSGTNIMKFIAPFVRGGSIIMTDEYNGYAPVRRIIRHEVIQHNERILVGLTDDEFPIQTNTIQCYWNVIKRGWYGSHHHCSRTVLYVAETC